MRNDLPVTGLVVLAKMTAFLKMCDIDRKIDATLGMELRCVQLIRSLR